jgi:hypothetical protein
MKRMKAVAIPLSVFAVIVALMMTYRSVAQSGSQKSNEPPKSQVTEQNKGQKKDVVIGYLHTRDRVVTISKDSKGAVYTVKDKNGKTLHAKLNEKDFEAKYPELYDQVKNGLAGNDATIYKPVVPADVPR